ncbi:extracellular catalytic domain type 2 short-chain-length polyhydroxyalkanoate depolymerase [Halomonas salipaludis]|uniref:Poly(3-hydroxybutyrate) depolymerase n=1 Tax=Halomonas salipaludis TaxID=2032625 RepID=A0A2A2EXW5_9GAMM|nr:PHB depolymerase family esterase [Halomonas salipaludis]PAU77528.1 poly(3-hydroxybutyrate) depolymerase [Halomonas salipaludis]
MKPTLLACGLALGLVGPALADSDTPPPLPVLDIDPSRVSVLGVSSGGYMATQLAVAFPETYRGLGVFAAGPWGCAQGSLRLALGQCMSQRHGSPSLAELEGRLTAYRAEGRLGAAEALAQQRVFVWHGEEDEVVDPALGEMLATQYRGWLERPEQLTFVSAEEVGHGLPVGGTGLAHITELADCRLGGSPHLLACDRDAAGEALNWLYGGLEPPEEDGHGTLLPFDQGEFYRGSGLAEQGQLYLPKACEEGAPCGLVVALHGCNMGQQQIEDAFVRHTGLNAWAAANRLAVLYPQAATSMANPQGCWDWWGFDESSWEPSAGYETRDGHQVQALHAMVERLSGGPARSP